MRVRKTDDVRCLASDSEVQHATPDVIAEETDRTKRTAKSECINEYEKRIKERMKEDREERKAMAKPSACVCPWPSLPGFA